jgi:hypothetical protein
LAAGAGELIAVPSLVLSGRTAGDLAKDAMELRVAAKAGIERGVEQCALSANVALKLIAVEEALHAPAVTELDNGEPGLLFEETAET